MDSSEFRERDSQVFQGLDLTENMQAAIGVSTL